MQKSITPLISGGQRIYTGNNDPVQTACFGAGKQLVLPARRNELFVITWFKKGVGSFTIDLSPYSIRDRSLFIVHPHSDYSLDTGPGNNRNGDGR